MSKELMELTDKIVMRMLYIDKDDKQEECPIGIININNWEWAQGVGLYGLFQYYKITGNQDILDYLIQWYKTQFEKGLPEKNVNTMAPMLTLALLYEETKNEDYLKVCSEWADWVLNEMPRTNFGGLQHIVSGHANEQQLWSDTLFMTVLFIAKYGVLTGEQKYIDESMKQFLIHIKYLFDKKTGLWFHGWTFIGNHNYAEALWARGNSWFTCGVVDYIEMIDLRGGLKDFLITTLEEQVQALLKYQNDNGMWHTLINDPTSYVETSATAAFGYGILKGVRKKYLNEKYLVAAKKAINAVVERVSDDGTVNEVSYGTAVGMDLESYKNVPLCPMTYGQALAILLLCEYIGNFNGGKNE